MSRPEVWCHDVTADRGGVTVLRGIDLEVPTGTWISLVGPNGSGKTTLLHVLAGLVDTRSGDVEVAGLKPAAAGRRALARVLALMPQRPVIPDGVSVFDLVKLGRTPHISRFGSESRHDLQMVSTVIDRLDLADLAHRQAATLSGGELQRVILARALAQEPRILLLDEPTSALDIGHQQQVLELVDSMRREGELTVVAAMHDLTSAAQYGDRLVVLDGGRLVADGPPTQVLSTELIHDVYSAAVDVIMRPDGPAVLPRRSGTVEG